MLMSQQVFPRPKCRVPTFVELSTTSNLVDEVPPKVESIDVVYHEGKIYVAVNLLASVVLFSHIFVIRPNLVFVL